MSFFPKQPKPQNRFCDPKQTDTSLDDAKDIGAKNREETHGKDT